MAFPFLWMGALTAGLFLAATFVTFAIAVRVLGHVAGEVRGSVLPGLVAGFRDWTAEPHPSVSRPPATDASPGAWIEELGPGSLTNIAPVTRR